MLEFPSRSIGSASDLLVIAPWKREMVDADELISPRTRMALTFRTLFQLRRYAREESSASWFSDPVERLEQVHSVRIRANPEGMLLAVTYDHMWEPYMAALHKDAGPILDLLLINCDGYVPARSLDPRPWAAWIRARECPADYFYAATPLTVADLASLAQGERRRREGPDPAASDRALASFPSVAAAAAIAAARAAAPPDQVHAQAIRVIAAMFRLTRLHGASIGPGPLQEDALTLLRTTRSLLEDWDTGSMPKPLRQLYGKELDWYEQQLPPARAPLPTPAFDRAKVQRGLLTSFDSEAFKVSHGAMLLLRIRDGSAARGSLAKLKLASEAGEAPADGIFRTLAFTHSGLTRIGVAETALLALGDAFRDGAAARCGQVGDLGSFHSAGWTRPARNWPKDAKGAVPFEAIDIVLVLRTAATGEDCHDPTDPAHPLHAEVTAIGGMPGLDLMAVEGLNRANPGKPGTDHLGFADGISQPDINATPGTHWSDRVDPGQLLLLDDGGARGPFREGSFLAIRRMALDRGKFDGLVAAGAVGTGLAEDAVRAKLLGRAATGDPLVPGTSGNDFAYAGDPDGAVCPLQSHVRRSNPRDAARPAPRILRRGMSFGPQVGIAGDAPRGSMFMASCADLASQYETLLLWVNGGNSTRLGSWAADPVVGPPLPGNARVFSFPDGAKVARLPLNGGGEPVARPTWSLYTFVPPIDFLSRLAAVPQGNAGPGPVERGKAVFDRLQLLAGQPPRIVADAWRAALRDPGAERTGVVDDLWAFVRARKNGVLRTPIGVMVGSLELTQQVLRDDGSRYSVKGAGGRLSQTIGNIHLGYDACSATYAREFGTANAALLSIGEQEAFELFRGATGKVVEAILTRSAALSATPPTVDIIGDLLEQSTGAVFPKWFDLPDGTHVRPGSQDWRPITGRTPLFPGDFWNCSRDAFIPIPSMEAGRLGRIEGPVLRAAANAHINAVGREGMKGKISGPIAADTKSYPTVDDVARVLIGVMLGAIATTLGNGGRILDRLAAGGDLQRLSFDWRAGDDSHADARRIFGPAMETTLQGRPVPELLWRIVQQEGLRLADVDLAREDVLILGVDSASFEERAAGVAPYVAFGSADRAPRPPHACPGRDMANGMLLGWMAGLADAADVKHTGASFMLQISRIP